MRFLVALPLLLGAALAHADNGEPVDCASLQAQLPLPLLQQTSGLPLAYARQIAGGCAFTDRDTGQPANYLLGLSAGYENGGRALPKLRRQVQSLSEQLECKAIDGLGEGATACSKPLLGTQVFFIKRDRIHTVTASSPLEYEKPELATKLRQAAQATAQAWAQRL
ncbi:hypothetical protein I5L56_15785 [Pseudomonas oryzihabitans]|uniref:hypothetical protein n=1 Tax=Pseudomonas oryzihabitans TaxID=47885 RepID=UPI0018DA0120|nr:hypothetical protein [Pseudomonas oryzihabitans]MBH3331091.1 hypothetical protein [Pseudomonas oryzihabitans]